VGAEKPKTQEICYALIGALHARMNRQNIGNIYKYMDMHFSKELQAVFHWDVEANDKSLIQTPAYIDWARRHGDMLSN
jgi:hypothetical protein